ncbi:hypothetical protein B0T16DRAFT_403349 [Cercophora newfieldiana]|uniref:Uncharacterized protein n=1 Tax=Cercophora newfieldiana TaxID=92897 RepID=A0AA39YEK5_9PEZI|nr:hypothetical protein B0T16DRAFT_403349 [Cercophora newfieldiana]
MVAGPETSILDIMSSPDPLNDSDATQTHLYSSARRVTRSQITKRVRSVESSPKKQTFALDVGSGISPQKILVTVQTEDADMSSRGGVNRRLFQSPTPKRSTRKKSAVTAGTTTTTVPLRGLTDDEGGAVTDTATPKARGRPRKPGTPAPTTTRRKKATGTPLAQRALTQARATRSSSVLASDVSEADSQAATPRATQPKRAPKRKASSPAKEDSILGSQRKRGRPRRTPVPSSDLGVVSEQESAADGEVEDNASIAQTEDNLSVAGGRADAAPSEGDEDIWLANLSDQPTPVARRSTRMNTSINIPETVAETSPEPQPSERATSEVDQLSGGDYGGGDDGGYADFGGMGSQSDAESLVDDNQDAQERQDTVAAGEDFTMINVHSLSSMMQLNSSVMTGAPPQAPEEEPQSDLGEETSLIIHGALESLRQSQRADASVPEREAPEETEQPSADYDRPAFGRSIMHQPPTRRSSQASSPQTSNLTPRRAAKRQSLGKQLAIKALQEAAASSPERRRAAVDIPEAHDTSAYDDSFSEIPEEVLTAATPRRPRATQGDVEEDTPRPDIQPSIERPSTVNHSNPQSESNRLLTPDETPSPVLSDDGDDEKQDTSPVAVPVPDAEMNSSPPIPSAPATQSALGGSVVRHARTHSTETPAEQLSAFNSPALAALNARAVNLPPPEPHPRPTLSPIVRAGRALQLVTSDPPSPPGRGSVLRSPFRGSVPRSSQSPVPTAAPTTQSPPQLQQQASAKQPERSWMSPLNRVKDFVVQGAQAFSPRLGSVSRMDDPFAPNPTESPKPASAGSFLASLGRKHPVAQRDAPTIASSTRAASLNDEDVMDWQGEDSPPRERSVSRESSIHAARGSPVRDSGDEVDEEHGVAQGGEADQDIEQDDDQSQAGLEDEEMRDEDHHFEEEEEEEEEEDIWAVEAQRPTPGKAAQPRREPIVEPPRRSKIPSPWRQNSKRLVYSDELHKLAEENAPQSEPEELSMLSQQNRPRPQAARQNLPPPKNVDLSEFFSSPVALPGAQEAAFGLFKALDAPRQEESTSFGRSTRGKPPVGSAYRRKQPFGGSQASQAPAAKQQAPQAFQRGRNLLDVSNVFTSAPTVNPLPQSSSPGTPERAKLAHIPQKTNFTPRSRQAQNSLFQPVAKKSLFGNNPVPVLSVEAEEDEPEEREDSMMEESSFIQPQLKPLPNRAVSPAKSSFRSPLKPKTPGRVVEFTSSTLSPLAQAQARAERLASASPEKQLSPISSHSSSHSEEDKENLQSGSDDAEQETVSASASASASMSMRPASQPQRRPVLGPPSSFSNTIANTTNARPPSPTKTQNQNQRLSRSEWTRDHWVRLDQLLQARKQGVLQFQLQLAHAPASVGKGKRRSVESQRLVGKKVSSQGEEMVLEEWHIDIVDAFCAEVGGWAADDIARRLFAAMVGEERRRLGLVPRRR